LFFLRMLLQWRPAYDAAISPAMFRYGYPVMITGLAGMTNEMFSRIALDAWLPKNFYAGQDANYAIGVFGAAYKFAVLMNLAVTAFRYAAEPFFFSNAADKNSPELFANINHYFIIVCCILLLGVSINLDVIKLMFLGQREYWEALHVVPVLLLAYLFFGVYYNLTVWFKLTDRTYFGTIITLLGAAITIAGNYFLIPLAGYEGSTLATLICSFTMMTLCYWLGQKYYPIPYRVGSGMAYIAFTFLLVYAVNAVPIENQWLASSFHALVLAVYLAVIYLLERKNLKPMRQ
jgi:O-antigen/teichoic acid export membrane protein